MSSSISQCYMFGPLLSVLSLLEQWLPSTAALLWRRRRHCPRLSTPQTASVKVLVHLAKSLLALQDCENEMLILTSNWHLQECGYMFCQGEIIIGRCVTVHLVAELQSPAWSPTSVGSAGRCGVVELLLNCLVPWLRRKSLISSGKKY